MNEVFLDTETTGLSFNEGHKIVEIACIETKDLIPTGKVFHRLINPNSSSIVNYSWFFYRFYWFSFIGAFYSENNICFSF